MQQVRVAEAFAIFPGRIFRKRSRKPLERVAALEGISFDSMTVGVESALRQISKSEARLND